MGLIERIGSEYAYFSGALRALSKVTKIAKNPGRTFPQVAEVLAQTHADRVALISDRERMTYRQYNERANQYARWALAQGIAKGDTVALMMPNRPEYLAAWLGIARAGGVTALLNTNLTGPALAHSVNIVRAKHVIVDAVLIDGFRTSEPHLELRPALWCHGAAPDGFSRLDSRLDDLPAGPVAADDLP